MTGTTVFIYFLLFLPGLTFGVHLSGGTNKLPCRVLEAEELACLYYLTFNWLRTVQTGETLEDLQEIHAHENTSTRHNMTGGRTHTGMFGHRNKSFATHIHQQITLHLWVHSVQKKSIH